MNIKALNSDCSLFQIHMAANMTRRPINCVYPMKAGGEMREGIFKAHHRRFMPFTTDDIGKDVNLMWTTSVGGMKVPTINHFVPLVWYVQ